MAWHRDGNEIAEPRQLLIELKKREDGTVRETLEEFDELQLAKRHEIAATLARLHANEADRRHLEAATREAQRDGTRRLIKLMHLDTIDQTRITTQTAQVTLQNEMNVIQDTMRRLEEQYQLAKKALSTIPDKNERHHQVQLAKEKRDIKLAPLRERLKELDPAARPMVSFEATPSDESVRLPFLRGTTPEKKASSTTYRQSTDQIRELQKARKTMIDPYMANLKMAKLWSRIKEHERAQENYEMALKTLSEKEKRKIPMEDMVHVLASERRRKREALHFLFMRSLQMKERSEAARMMRKYLELATSRERLSTVSYLEEILRNVEYIEDPSLSTPEQVTTTILCSNSLGPLTDLRFELVQELLVTSPHDPYLLESVAHFHVRKHEFTNGKNVCDRFVKLPDVKRIQLYATFAEFTPVSRSHGCNN